MIPHYLDQYVHGEVREPGADVNLETRYLHSIINETNVPVCDSVSLTFEKNGIRITFSPTKCKLV